MKILTISFTWNLPIWFTYRRSIDTKHHRNYNLYFQWFDYWTVSELKSAKKPMNCFRWQLMHLCPAGTNKNWSEKKNIKKKRKFWRSFHSFRQRNIKIHSDSNIFISKSKNKLLDSNLNLPLITSLQKIINKKYCLVLYLLFNWSSNEKLTSIRLTDLFF